MKLNTVAQVFQINSEDMLKAVRTQFEIDLETSLEHLTSALAKNVLSSDVVAVQTHMGYVECYRDKVTKYLMLAEALVEHAKSDHPAFLLPAEKGVTDIKRDSHRRGLAGGFVAMANRLSRLLDSIDCRVNLCKKILGVESNVVGLGIQRRV